MPTVFNTVNKSHPHDKKIWKAVFQSWTKGSPLPQEAKVPGTSTLFAFTASGQPIKIDPALRKESPSRRLQAILEAFARMPESARRPAAAREKIDAAALKYASGGGRYTGAEPPPHRLILRAYSRAITGNEVSGYRPARLNVTQFQLGESGCLEGAAAFKAEKASVPEPFKDTFWLTEAEWTALVPTHRQKGDKLAVPHSVTRRLLLYGCHNWWASETLIKLWAPDAIKHAALVATVVERTPAGARLRLDGDFALSQLKPYPANFKGRIHGRLHYDFKAQAFTRFDMVVVGDFQGIFSCRNNQTWGPAPMAFAFELGRPGTAVDDVLPIGILPHQGGKDYLSPVRK